MPGTQVWVAVATVLTRGLESLHPTARWAIVAGAIIGLALEITNKKTQGRFPLSGTGMGLAFVIPFSTCLAMFLGALSFWLLQKTLKNPDGRIYRIGVENQETVCAGAIAGGSIVGIIIIGLNSRAFF